MLTAIVELLIAIGLVVLGLVLVTVEVYVMPGLNITGVLGLLCVLFGWALAVMQTSFLVSLLVVGGTMAVGGILFGIYQRTGAWQRFVLAVAMQSSDTSVARGSEHRSKYLGKVGTAITPLRPTGVVEVDGERIEVATEGAFIAAGSQVRVVAMDRQRYFVRLADAVSEDASSS